MNALLAPLGPPALLPAAVGPLQQLTAAQLAELVQLTQLQAEQAAW